MSTKSVVSSPHSLGLDYLTPPNASPSQKKNRGEVTNSEPHKKCIPAAYNTVLIRIVFSYLKPGEETCLASRVCRSWRFCRYHLSSDELLVRATSVMHSLDLSKVRNYLLNYLEKYPNLHAIHFNSDRLEEIENQDEETHQERRMMAMQMMAAAIDLKFHLHSLNIDINLSMRVLTMLASRVHSFVYLTYLKLPFTPITPHHQFAGLHAFRHLPGFSSPTVTHLEFTALCPLLRKEISKLNIDSRRLLH